MNVELPNLLAVHFAVITIFLCTSVNLHGQCQSPCIPTTHASEFSALEAIYCATNGDNWKNNDGWYEAINFGTNCNYCEWYGVLCNEEENVISIDLDGKDTHNHAHSGGNDLSGSIPANILNLQYLEKLHLSHNDLGDTLLNEIFDLSNLAYLDLSYNSFEGNLPSYSNYHFYERFDLSHNSFSGEVQNMTEEGFGGEIIDLSFNQFQGSLPKIGAFDLYLNNNNFSGNLDAIQYYTFVEKINLSHNQFTGEIPKVVTSLIYATINFSNNDLSGCFPQNLVTYCENNALNVNGNLKLPWFGSLGEFCGTIGTQQFQYGAPCDDGIISNGSSDIILNDCSCGPKPVSTIDLKNNMVFYPNPTSGIINIRTLVDRPLSYSLFDARGHLIRVDALQEDFVDISNLKTGIYILKIDLADGGVLVNKIIKI